MTEQATDAIGVDGGPRAGMPLSGPVLLYDGLCGFCDGTVRAVLRLDRAGTFCFAPLQGELAAGVLARHPDLVGVDSLILVEPATGDVPERVHARSDAILGVFRHLGGGWAALGVLGFVPRPLRDRVYDAFARRRRRFFGRRTACRIPEPGVRSRFLE